MEEDIAYQLAAVAVGASIVAAIRLSPGCEPAEFVARVLDAVTWEDGSIVDETKLPILTAPAISSLNHRLNIAVGYLGIDEGERNLAVNNARQIIEFYVLDSTQEG